MKKTALYKLVFREIRHSKARFLSILVLILLGVGFFVGLQATGPNMLNTVDDYFDEKKLYDAHIQSTMGIEDNEVRLLSEYDPIEYIEEGYSQDVLVGENRIVMKLISYHPDKDLNQYEIASGRLPEKSGEIALDERDMIQSLHQIGDEIMLVADRDETDLADQFERIEYEIVGFVRSPRFITNDSRGQTSIAGGQLDGFGVIMEEDFNLPVYTDLFVSFTGLREINTFSDEYQEQSRIHASEIERILEEYSPERLSEIRSEAEVEIRDAEAQIEDGRKELTEAREELSDARSELDDAQLAIQEARETLGEAEQELNDGEAEYKQGLVVFQSEMGQADAQLAQARREIDSQAEQLESGLADLEAAERELNQAEEQLESQRNELITAQVEFTELTNVLSELLDIPAELVPEEGIEPLLTETESIELNGQTLADLLGGYFAGEVPVEVVEGALDGIASELEAGLSQIDEASLAIAQQRSTLEGARAELEAGQEMLADARTELGEQSAVLERERSNAEEELSRARRDLDQGWQEYNDGVAELDRNELELIEAEEEYLEGLETFEEEEQDALAEIEEAEAEIADVREELAAIEEPTYYTLLREDDMNFIQYEENAALLSELATIFPAVFFAVAALVTLTTITRMIEEQRTEIGTLKALGYRDFEISIKYYVYAVSASLLGTVFGLIIGYITLPIIIFNAYGIMYNLPDLILANYWSYTLIAAAIALLSTVVTAWVVLRKDLKSHPAALMRPKAPKIGKRILLERISPIWKRLDFMKKVTARNLFRYKQRMLMTVIGVAGCAALIIAGFGIQGAVEGLADLQFGDVMRYDAMVILDDEANEESQLSYQQFVQSYDGIDQTSMIKQQQFEMSHPDLLTQDLTVIVPEDSDRFNDFIQLQDRTSDEVYQLPDEGAIVTERLADLFEVGIGDTLTIEDADNRSYQIKIVEIAENYIGHYLFMTESVYRSEIDDSIRYNANLINYDQDESWENEFSEQLMLEDQVVTVTFIGSMTDAFRDSMESLNLVVFVLIIAAAGLAFVVLYNLTNINISERIRELSTIKVLGFFDTEVTMYIYRENIVLTVMGIIAGSIFGRFLFSFVLDTITMDNQMFNPALHWTSYLYSALLTLFFSTFVMWLMHNKLKRIDMIESLKSNE